MMIRTLTLSLCLLLAACSDDQAPSPAEPAPPSLPAEVPAAAVVPPAPRAASESVKKPRPPALPELPHAPVDLSLPDELIEDLQLGKPIPAEQEQALLPPLFVEKPAAQGKLQLNGRLLFNEEIKDDYVKSVEGAELQLQYKP